MSNEPASAAKTCIVCHQDCSNRPRQKDAQGRYVCQDCLNKAAVKGAPAKMPTPDKGVDPGLAAALVGVDQGAMTPCPNCGILLKAEAVLCTSCGFDVGKGKAIRTRVSAEKGVKTGGGGDFKLPVSWDVIAGIMTFLIIGAGLFAVFVPAGIMVFNIMLAINSLIVGLMVVIIPFQDKQIGWGIFNLCALPLGIVFLIGGMFPVGLGLILAVPWAILYYVFKVNWRASLKRLYLAGFLGGIMVIFLVVAHGPDTIANSLGIDTKKDAPGTKSDTPAEPDADSEGPGDATPNTIKFPGGA